MCLIIDTEKLTEAFTKKKLKYLYQKYLKISIKPKTSVLNLTKLIDLLPSTAQAIFWVQIQFRYLQQEQILAL